MKIPGKKWMAVVALLAAPALGAEPPPEAGAEPEPVFARVDGTAISVALYDLQLNVAIRDRFYHRRPPPEELAKLRHEVGDALIDRILLLAEARRRGLQPDADKLRQSLAQFEERNRANPRWQEARERLLATLEQELGGDELLAQLEAGVRRAPEPQPEQLRRYYDEHRNEFTEPERLRLSIILLKVDPGLPPPEKAKFLEQGKALHARLAAGEDFAALAKEYSNDESAPKGGDMGYVHRGMLGEEVLGHLEKLAPGAYSEPLVLMEGVAILRLDERLAPQLKDLEQSRERAAMLWQREESERQWRQLKLSLRQSAKVEIIDATRYPANDERKP